MNVPGSLTAEESFEHQLRCLLQWLSVMTMEPIELCDTWGNYNVAWELVDDLKGDGAAVTSAHCSYLTKSQRQDVLNFLYSLTLIPEDILVGATTVAANIQAMSHPCWIPYKKSAAALILSLESAAERNRKYFECL